MQHVLVDGECTTCSRSQPSVDEPPQHLHVLDNGICTTCDPEDLLDEDSAALLQALNEMDGPLGDAQRAFDPAKHARNPKGGPGGGRFRSMVDRIKDAIDAHSKGGGEGHPLDGFDREQLRKVAKSRGIELKRGEGRDSIAAKLIGHLAPRSEKSALPKAKPLVRKTTSTGKLQPHVAGEAERELNAKVRVAKKDLTPGQLKAVEQWTSGKGMVRKIQTGQVSEATTRNFDEAMQTLPKVDGLVYRAVSSEGQSSQFAANLRPGQVLDLGAPVSTSIDPRKSGAFGTNLYEIESPAASYLAGVGSKFGYEKEAVLAPGRYEVVSSEYATMGLGKNTAQVLVVRLRDVTQGDRSWKPTTGTDFKLHEPKPAHEKPQANGFEQRVEHAKTGAEAIHAAPYVRDSSNRPQNKDDQVEQSLLRYMGQFYRPINRRLREDKVDEDPFIREQVDNIDSVMGPMKADVQTWRGIQSASTVFGDAWNDHDVTGMEWRDDGYASTSADKTLSNRDDFSGPDGAVMRLLVPKGAQAAGLSDTTEMELLLGRGQTFRVVADHGIVDGRRQLDVEVVVP